MLCEDSYLAHEPTARRLMKCIHEEVASLLESADVALGLPVEARIKTWASIKDKMSRREVQFSSISDVSDLVGLRFVLLFRSDLEKVKRLIEENFSLLSSEDTTDRLGDTQFGYQSQHMIVTIKDQWLAVPRYKGLRDSVAEIQIRTMAQHIWATASHKLQYKREESVPIPVRRTISRVSALLETVDLELDRVLTERTEYVGAKSGNNTFSDDLNVDLLSVITSEIFPSRPNDNQLDGLDEVLSELSVFGIKRADQLRSMLQDNYDKVIEEDRRCAENYPEYSSISKKHPGIYFNLAGLVRQAIAERFGQEKMLEVMKELGTDSADAL
jgi:putative GTP pyrophosphokinase